MPERESIQPGSSALRRQRERMSIRDELILAIMPTVTVLAVFALVEVATRQRLLFASLASSAFLIYLDPEHGTNRTKTLAVSQLMAAITGYAAFEIIGPSYIAGAIAMVVTITLMIVFDVVHPPAAATALAFAFRTGDEKNVLLFVVAVVLVVALVLTEIATLAILARIKRRTS